MQPLATVLRSTGVAQKLELNGSLQLDNPPSTKKERVANICKGVRRSKRPVKPKISPQLLCLLKSSSKEYLSQIAQNEAALLKADYHGAEVAVVKSRCFSFVGLQGTIVRETFSTFSICDAAEPAKAKTVPKAGCIFKIKVGDREHLINGDQFVCSSGFRISKKFKSKESFYL